MSSFLTWGQIAEREHEKAEAAASRAAREASRAEILKTCVMDAGRQGCISEGQVQQALSAAAAATESRDIAMASAEACEACALGIAAAKANALGEASVERLREMSRAAADSANLAAQSAHTAQEAAETAQDAALLGTYQNRMEDVDTLEAENPERQSDEMVALVEPLEAGNPDRQSDETVALVEPLVAGHPPEQSEGAVVVVATLEPGNPLRQSEQAMCPGCQPACFARFAFTPGENGTDPGMIPRESPGLDIQDFQITAIDQGPVLRRP